LSSGASQELPFDWQQEHRGDGPNELNCRGVGWKPYAGPPSTAALILFGTVPDPMNDQLGHRECCAAVLQGLEIAESADGRSGSIAMSPTRRSPEPLRSRGLAFPSRSRGRKLTLGTVCAAWQTNPPSVLDHSSVKPTIGISCCCLTMRSGEFKIAARWLAGR